MKYIVENLLPVESTKGLNILVNGGKLLFNTISKIKNQNAKDIPYPDVNYYGADYMTPTNRLEFLSWFEKQMVFDLQIELKV